MSRAIENVALRLGHDNQDRSRLRRKMYLEGYWLVGTGQQQTTNDTAELQCLQGREAEKGTVHDVVRWPSLKKRGNTSERTGRERDKQALKVVWCGWQA